MPNVVTHLVSSLIVLGEGFLDNRIGGSIGTAAGLIGGSVSALYGDTSVPAFAGIAASCLAGGLLSEYLVRVTTDSMARPRVSKRYCSEYPACTGRTNSGNDVFIAVSGWDKNGAIAFDEVDALVFKKYLERHRSFLGVQVGNVHLVRSAKAKDFSDAIMDPKVSSIALFGHSNYGSWRATDKEVYWTDVAELTERSGMCKNGFGLKTGCNPIKDRYKDRYQVLSPLYGHAVHAGDLFIVGGVASAQRGELSGSQDTYGLGYHPRLEKLVQSMSC